MVWDIFKGAKQTSNIEKISITPPPSARDEFLNEHQNSPLVEKSEDLWRELQIQSPQVYAAFVEILELCQGALRPQIRSLGDPGKYLYALIDKEGRTKHTYWLIGRDDDQDAARAIYIHMRRAGYIDVTQETGLDGKERKAITSGHKMFYPLPRMEEQKRSAS